jgi:hypothetical protein
LVTRGRLREISEMPLLPLRGQNVSGMHQHQLINVLTAGAHAFLMDYTQREWAITHDAGSSRDGMYVCIIISHKVRDGNNINYVDVLTSNK